MASAKNGEQIRLERRTSLYWRVTFDHPPLNIFGPETIPQLNEIVTALETDSDVKVVVFDSAVDGFFLTHYNFLANLEDTTRLAPNAVVAASRRAGAAQPRSGRVDRLNPRTRDRRRKRACARVRYALRQSRTGHLVAI
jgi:enoyl-CoA hydratase/carnithine racemase